MALKNFQKNFQKVSNIKFTRHVLIYTTKIYYIHLPIYSIYYINIIKQYFKNFKLFYKKYYLILKYDFLQKLFKRKKLYYKKVGYNPRYCLFGLFVKNNSKYCSLFHGFVKHDVKNDGNNYIFDYKR